MPNMVSYLNFPKFGYELTGEKRVRLHMHIIPSIV